ncbi:hypothetical protein [Ottowia testudinis]|uniref:Uncharacterized protein n=1 Tax=Ottowia testudinis TaxID=2816950 RepID=A0A975CET6_9BURK|nr:hypothetical protein [Ottowia testudinis]QTD45128.1 hypothetical protein J1M35_19230 [Ottowia testudinis]
MITNKIADKRLISFIFCAFVASCGGDGPAIEARPQTIAATPAPAALALGSTAAIAAQASSGLPVAYGSATPATCSVDAASGAVKALAAGTCTINVNQSGNATYTAAPQFSWATTVTGDAPPPAPLPPGRVRYQIVTTFYEPDTQPRNSVFTGSFELDTATGAISGLQGSLTESMSGSPLAPAPGYGMSVLHLKHQLSAVYDPALGGWLVTTFLNDNTRTLAVMNGSDGWSPGTGRGLHHNFPNANPGNAYARVFINPKNPTAPLIPAQIDKLAYADCAPEGMMGSTCMTGTSVAGYGAIGTMSGYPLSQVITRLVP